MGFHGSTEFNSFSLVDDVDGFHKLRCVKIMAAEHTYKLLLTEMKKRKRDDGVPPGEENDAVNGAPAKAKASKRKGKAKAKAS